MCAALVGRCTANTMVLLTRASKTVAERVTARALHRGRLVVLEALVARHTGRAIVSWLCLMRLMTASALRVAGNAMEAGTRRRCVAARARRRLRDSARSVRPVTARARGVLAVTDSGFLRVAIRAGRRRQPLAAMRFVAGRARLMSLGSRARFSGVAGRARRRRPLRLVRSAGVAVRARAMAAVCGCRDRSVAARARWRSCRRFVCSLRVTAFACAVPGRSNAPRLLGMTVRAQRCR